MKYFLQTYGCQYNEWDEARLRYFLDSIGLTESGEKEAGLIIIIACAVRQTAVDRIFGKIKTCSTSESKSPLILVTGCLLDSDLEKLEKKGVVFFESGDLKTLFQILAKHFKTKFTEIKLGKFYEILSEQNSQSMYVPITIGCNNFCSYCAVPYTRGRERSRPMKEIIEDVKSLIQKGHKEIMLLGQNVNSYADNPKLKTQDAKKKSDFSLLLEQLSALPGDFIISFTSNHPKDMTDDIIEAVATLPKIKKLIHLPLQSGSDKILKVMNRPYTTSQYLDIVRKIRKASAEIKISTDAIVGFPGETEKDFRKTVEVFNLVDYVVAYVNKYSPRKGTAAYELGDPISWAEKQHRWHVLNDIANKK